MKRGTMIGLVVAAVAAVGPACDDPERVERADEAGDGDGSDDESAVEIDADEVMELAADFSSALVRLSDEPEYEETHADAAAVVVWASPSAADLIRSIDANDPSQSITFTPGTLVVKEHLDEAGATRGMSVMYKGEPGYNPEGGDWFWARVDGGTTTDRGRVDWCSGCHAAAHNTDFVVGFEKSP